MATRQLAGVEDLLLGQGQTEQTRENQLYVITKINASTIPYQAEPGEANYKSIKDIIDALVVGGDDTVVEW